jgi:hypothetical protein
MMKLLVYDAEILNAIPEKGMAPLEGIRYCQGWGDKVGMGVSVICAYSWDIGRPRVFLQDNFEEFKALAEDPETLLVGFNNHAFDDPLIRAALGITLDERRSWDLLRAYRVARGQDPGYIAGGANLDKLCKANFLPGKSGSGAFAPILWQKGKYGQVIDYCLSDCYQTVKLIELVLDGRLRDHESGRILLMPAPLPNSL